MSAARKIRISLGDLVHARASMVVDVAHLDASLSKPCPGLEEADAIMRAHRDHAQRVIAMIDELMRSERPCLVEVA